MSTREGCFRDGCRNRAAMIYAHLLKLNGVSLDDARLLLDQLGSQCKPPLTPERIRAVIKSAFEKKRHKFTYQTIADWLEVDPAEAEIISQKIGKPYPAASRFGYIASPSNPGLKETRASRQFARRHEIRSIIEDEEAGNSPSLRAMKVKLSARGIKASRVTIRADYAALGIPTRDSRCVGADTPRTAETQANHLDGKGCL
jgi:hypothetical protein